MTRFKSVLIGALALVASTGVQAQAKSDHAHHAAKAPAATSDIVPAAASAVTVVERFGNALAAGDFKTVSALLDPTVLILESGGMERSREEYLGHHAKSDAAFLKGSHVQVQRRTARIDGPLAWVGTLSELHATKDGKPLTLLSTETMVLRRSGSAWLIVHIHWSSRPKPAASAVIQESGADTRRRRDVDAPEDAEALLSGAGAGQSMVAERRGIPGPRHVLEQAEALALSQTQFAAVERIRSHMQARAVALGRDVLEAETGLDRLFAAPIADTAAIERQVAHVGALRAALRQVHLDAHLATAPVLSATQRLQYASLRGLAHEHRE